MRIVPTNTEVQAKSADWHEIGKCRGKLEGCPILLAGGLNPQNVETKLFKPPLPGASIPPAASNRALAVKDIALV